MTDNNNARIRELIARISRIMAAEEWKDEINPSQWAALSYLAEANRFSRAPSQVAEYMSATRGTVSQTLKTLARKGFIEEVRSDTDKRSISYSVTKKGKKLVEQRHELEDTFHLSDEALTNALAEGLEALVRNALKKRGQRPFGVCKTCDHNRKSKDGWFCDLLQEPLKLNEIKQLCHEHTESA